jgi:DNA-binding NtrC family response regulator
MHDSSFLARILVVDDDQTLLDALPAAIQLRFRRVEVHTAVSPSDALHRLGEGTFDIVVSDFTMPVTDGLTFLRAVRTVSPTTELMLMSGNDDTDIREEATRLGVIFLDKPLDRNLLTTVLRSVLLRRMGVDEEASNRPV